MVAGGIFVHDIFWGRVMDKIPDEVFEAMITAFAGSPASQTPKIMKYRRMSEIAMLRAAEAMGWVLVPVEATTEMNAAADIANDDYDGYGGFFADVWAAMLAVRLKVPDEL